MLKDDLIICKCQWNDYYDYRIMTNDGNGHVRVSFFDDEIIISDLYVDVSQRNKGIATKLLDYVDTLTKDKKVNIVPSCDWCCMWYKKRGYIIKEDY